MAESSLQSKKRASKELPVFPLDIRFGCPIPWQFFVSSVSIGVGFRFRVMMDAGFRPELLGGQWEQSRGPVFHTAGSWVCRVCIPFL